MTIRRKVISVLEVKMLGLPAIVTPLAVVAFLASVQAAPAQTTQPREATRSAPLHGHASGPASRAKTGLPRTTAPDEKNWMDRASGASNGGGGGGGGM
jgi:hypothetical protein